MRKKYTVIVALLAALVAIRAESLYAGYAGYAGAGELPRPSYDNSLVFSIVYSLTSPAADTEMEYMKSRFGSGLYAPLVCGTFVALDMDWRINPAGAESDIEYFKTKVDDLLQRAKTYGVGLHITLSYGISREVQLYNPAKDEDIRAAQWYNDNNLMSENQWNIIKTLPAHAQEEPQDNRWVFNHNKIDGSYGAGEAEDAAKASSPGLVGQYACTTMSRYARKLRNHLEAKVKAAFAYLTLKQRQNPDLLLVISADGEAEMNLHPVNHFGFLQEYFCDFSPFAVMEFRDWIKHEGLYAENKKYAGEGYANGGSRYKGAGADGLQNFNLDFGNSFTTWNLKYYHWNLSDPVDTDYTDNINPDPNAIPFPSYTFNGMMPAVGPRFIDGGFDPPRLMKQKDEDPFWDLWQLFRETMVHHYVKDMAVIARASGFEKNHYYTHQIPGDYLFGTRPNDPDILFLNPRYYSSASPLWTANAYSDIGLGITMYDINFGAWYARTSRYILPVISSLSGNWGAMEYNPEIIPQGPGYNIQPASAQSIYEQVMKLYNNNVHFIGFFKWLSTMEHQFKGNNREEALKLFFAAVKDKARQSTDTVFTPKKVEGFTGSYNSVDDSADLSWSRYIWTDLNHTWSNWGDFKEFVIYRGYTENFQPGPITEIARLRGNSYKDSNVGDAPVVYYRIAAANSMGGEGDVVKIGLMTGKTNGKPYLSVSRSYLNFGAVKGGFATPAQTLSIANAGKGVLSWSVTDNADWLDVNPPGGFDSGVVTVTANAAGLSAGAYTAAITIDAPNTIGSPQSVQATFTVYAVGQDAAPFGAFETPIQGSTVRGSVPFTGWVLDDIGVESVKIYREEGAKPVYIGDALRVEGARPDVETGYPLYPENFKAGWGYMMLTNVLPGGGNGSFVFYAVARDVAGHEVTLGTKTVTCDNAYAVKPFGAIDTPTPGGVASGSRYRNYGWVLTPKPNCINSNGSTIYVFVDGSKVGSPVYNIYRADIASLFPGYCNSHGAHGYFELDTTLYKNGVHTISWGAKDNAGNVDGIGSRYFIIRN
ncbi:MAG: hypothetical protein NT166_08395 [Candidatus Aminicenantes bacterium]|nr:hypothetical protein [Candidatus Aminicenantes bacterium]